MSLRVPHRLVSAITCVLMLTGALAPSGSTQTPDATPVSGIEPSFQQHDCVRELPSPLQEGESAICGTVTAPMYYDRKSDETVKLSVIRIASTAEEPAENPLVMLTGGPGQPLDALLPLFGDEVPLYRPFLEVQDVILFDQRGMGMSEPTLACPSERQAADAADNQASPEASPVMEDPFTPILECGQQLLDSGIDPTAFTTTSNAADVNSIREALGEEKVDLLGTSYGSELALATMRDHPEAIGSVILGSTLPLEANFLSSQLTAFDQSLKLIFARCEEDPECASANPDLAQTLEDLVAQLNESPVTVQTTDLITGEPLEVPVNGALFMSLLYTTTFTTSGITTVPQLITSTVAGDTTFLENLIPLLLIPAETNQGALFTFTCQQEYPHTSEDAIDRELAETDALPVIREGSFIGVTAMALIVCGTWNYPTAPELTNQPVESDIPALIVAGEFDPITPPQFADDVAANLSNSTVVHVPGLGHDPVTSGGECTIGIATRFLADPEAPVDDSCVDQFTPDFSPQQAPEASPAASPAALPIS